MIVLTDYNNKTYKIDDVDFESSPMTKFSTKDGEISFTEYYKKVCRLTAKLIGLKLIKYSKLQSAIISPFETLNNRCWCPVQQRRIFVPVSIS